MLWYPNTPLLPPLLTPATRKALFGLTQEPHRGGGGGWGDLEKWLEQSPLPISTEQHPSGHGHGIGTGAMGP